MLTFDLIWHLTYVLKARRDFLVGGGGFILGLVAEQVAGGQGGGVGHLQHGGDAGPPALPAPLGGQRQRGTAGPAAPRVLQIDGHGP